MIYQSFFFDLILLLWSKLFNFANFFIALAFTGIFSIFGLLVFFIFHLSVVSVTLNRTEKPLLFIYFFSFLVAEHKQYKKLSQNGLSKRA